MGEERGAAAGAPSLVGVNIQDVIRERKAERKLKAEETRQSGLQRIKDMKSTSGIDPLQRFPKEIWMQIFDELDPEDKGSIWQLHPLFRDLMEKIRIRDILFPQVLQVIQSHSQYRRLLWPDSDWRRRNYLNSQLRRISKSSRKSFDRWIDSRVTERIQEPSSGYDSHVIHLGFSETDERERVKKLLTSFEDSGKRFFPRGLSVDLSQFDMLEEEFIIAVDLMDEFKKDITALLQKVGDQIWHFSFSLEHLGTINFSSSDVYILFQSWISLMPNLKWLGVMIMPPFQMIGNSKSNSTLKKFPFPRLSRLERLGLYSKFQLQKKGFQNIYSVILGANQHIKMLDLNYGDGKHSNLPHVPPNLTQSLQLKMLSVKDNYSDVFKYSKVRLVDIRPVINLNWRLETIDLSLSSGAGGGSATRDSITSVFHFLQKFPTLRKVKLRRMKNFRVRDTDKLGYLELPNLTDFLVELTAPELDYDSNIHFFFSLQFLVKCEKLKRIFWMMKGFINDSKLREHLKMKEIENCREVIDFRGGLRYLYDSNIWQVFAGLKCIHTTFERVVGTDYHYCSHDYLREDLERMSMKQFLKRHVCVRKNHADHCFI